MPTEHHLQALPALVLDTLANQTCSLLRRKPNHLTERDEDTLAAASAYINDVLLGIEVVGGAEVAGLTPRSVQVFGFAARADRELKRLTRGNEAVRDLFSHADGVLRQASRSASVVDITDVDKDILVGLFTALSVPARADLRQANQRSAPRSPTRTTG